MPELPDVSVFKKYLDSTSLHQRIQRVDITDKEALGGVGPRRLTKKLEGHKLVSSRQHGKYLFVETDNAGWLLLHFGMTGFLKYFRNESEKPPHARVLFRFANGYVLGYDNQRKLGKVDLVESPEAAIEAKNLGPDPLHSQFDLRGFRELTKGRSGSVKSFLMDQEILAGIGNVYSDEILFEAGIHPGSAVANLDDELVEKLYRSMRKVLRQAIERQVDVDRFPKRSLLPNREAGKPCPRCNGKIAKKTVAGRSAYFCNRHQVKP